MLCPIKSLDEIVKYFLLRFSRLLECGMLAFFAYTAVRVFERSRSRNVMKV